MRRRPLVRAKLVRQKRLKEPTRLVTEKVLAPKPNITPAEHRALLEAERLGKTEPLEQPKVLAELGPVAPKLTQSEATKIGLAKARAAGRVGGRPRSPNPVRPYRGNKPT
jgi:hypothetical protein